MPDYQVLGGHENAEFRQHDENSIELYSTEVNPETGEEIGTVGTFTADEFEAVGETLRAVHDEGGAEAPDFDDVAMGQHGLTGAILFISVDDDGNKDMDTGAAFGDTEDILDAVDSFDN